MPEKVKNHARSMTGFSSPMPDKYVTLSIRLPHYFHEELTKAATKNCRSIGGEVRFRLGA